MTQRSADFFCLHDRGVIEPGKRGDLAVFALDEIETRDLERRYDLPEGRLPIQPPTAPGSARWPSRASSPSPTATSTGARPARLGSLAELSTST